VPGVSLQKKPPNDTRVKGSTPTSECPPRPWGVDRSTEVTPITSPQFSSGNAQRTFQIKNKHTHKYRAVRIRGQDDDDDDGDDDDDRKEEMMVCW